MLQRFLPVLCLLVFIKANGAVVYTQPHNNSASLYQSSVNGTDYDQLTWDDFRLTNATAITEIRWRGGYLYGGMYSGTVTNWTISIYGDIANGYQPDIINPPLATYSVAGNAGQTNVGNFGGTVMYDYSFVLPNPFQAASNQFYWVRIEARQSGIPEWGIARGTGGSGQCFRQIANVGDWWFYRGSGDTAFTLLASDASTITIDASAVPVAGGTILGAGAYPVGASVSLTANPASGYGFAKWTQSGVQVSTAKNYKFTATTNRILEANFVAAYTINVSAGPSYGGSASGGGTFNSNATVTLVAAAASGFQFVNWTEFGTPVSTLRTYTFPATDNRVLVANFATLPQTAVFDFDTGTPSLSPHQGMPGSQTKAEMTAYFTSLTGGWSIQNDIYGWVSPLFSGNFLYPSTWWSTLSVQFSQPVTNVSLKFVTADLTTAGDVPTIVRCTGYTNSLSNPAVGSATAQGAQWVNGPYPDGTLTFGSATPFDIIKLDFPSGQPVTISGLLFVDNIVVQQPLVAPTNITITTSDFPTYGGLTSGDGTYANGASVSVVATPNAGYAFLNWTEGGVVVSTSRTNTFTATNSHSLVANFAALYSIAASATPTAGGRTTGGGAFLEGASVTVSAIASNGFFFVNWTESGIPVSNTTNYTFTANIDRTLVANFASGWNITTSSSPGSGGTTSGGGGYTNGAAVTVVATPNANYTFLGWKQGSTVVTSTPSYSFTVTTNRTLTAFFVRSYLVTTMTSPAEGGSTSGLGSYTNGASVTVRALPNPGYLFTNWTENGTSISTATNYTFTVTSNRVLVANYLLDVPMFNLSVSASPGEGGTVSGAGAYTNGALATVIATPNTNFAFVDWKANGLTVSTNASYSFTILTNQTLVAFFVATATNYTIAASALPTNGGTVSGDGVYPVDQWAGLTATANPGYAFVNWTVNNTPVSVWPIYFALVDTNHTLEAHFTNAVTISTRSSDTNAGMTVGDGSFPAGLTVGVMATPKTGYLFANWTEDSVAVSSNASWQFAALSNHTLIANFVPDNTAVTFDFDTATPTLTNMQTVPFDQTAGPLAARFSASAVGGFSVMTDTNYGWTISKVSSNYLSPNVTSDLFIQFPQPLTRIALTFATFDFQDLITPTPILLEAFLNTTNFPIGSLTATGVVNVADGVPVAGGLEFHAVKPFNLIRLSVPFSPTGTTEFLVDNIHATLVPAVKMQLAAGLPTISWPRCETYQLQMNMDFKTTNWVTITNDITVMGGSKQFSIIPAPGAVFFRLLRQ